MNKEISKTIIVARHGVLYNPSGKIYNRDSVMRKEDWMHLSDEGKAGMEKLAKDISSLSGHFPVIFSSPSIRAIESSRILASILHIPKIVPKEDLDDVLCRKPYEQGMTMKELEKLHGDIYDVCLETPEEVAERMVKVFWEMYDYIRPGETGTLVSHGDPIGWLTHKLINNALPSPKNIRDELYPPKSGAFEFIIEKQGAISSWRTLHNTFDKNIY